jgi:uncharacterized membrane-anchored protein
MPALNAHALDDDDHHFVLPDGVVITIPRKDCNMFTAATRANAMLKALGIGHPEGEPEYVWAATSFEGVGYFLYDREVLGYKR